MPELRKTVFGLLAETGKKRQSGKLALSITNLIILPPSLTLEVFCFPLLLPVTISAQNQMTAGFTFLSQKKIEREREEDGNDLVQAGGFTGSQETWTMQMFNKSLSSSPAFLRLPSAGDF